MRSVLARLPRPRIIHPDDFVVAVVPYVVFAALVVWLAVLAPDSLTLDQITGNVDVTLILVLVAIGQTFVLLTGGIDLSIGGVISCVNAFAASHMASSGAAWGWTIALLLIGWAPGAINGALIAYARLQPFIVTLAAWFVWGGIAFYFLEASGGEVSPSLGWLASGAIAGVHNSIWLLLLVAIIASWLLRTRTGLQIKAVGSSADNARQRGIPTRRTIVVTYGLSSWLAAFAGIVLSAQSLSGDPVVGDSYILLSVAAAVIGGTSLFGGRGTTTGTILGAFVLTYLTSIVYVLGLPSQWSLIFSGLLLIGSVTLQLVVRRGFALRRRTRHA